MIELYNPNDYKNPTDRLELAKDSLVALKLLSKKNRPEGKGSWNISCTLAWCGFADGQGLQNAERMIDVNNINHMVRLTTAAYEATKASDIPIVVEKQDKQQPAPTPQGNVSPSTGSTEKPSVDTNTVEKADKPEEAKAKTTENEDKPKNDVKVDKSPKKPSKKIVLKNKKSLRNKGKKKK